MNIVDVLSKYISPYYYYIITILVLILFIIISYYAYDKYQKTTVNKYKDVANANRNNKEATIMFFHVDWCPHCKTAQPFWDTFKSQNDKTEINGYVIKCVDMNCTNETSDITRAINTYNIESYPTIKMLKDEQTIEFDSKITNETLNSFVQTMLND